MHSKESNVDRKEFDKQIKTYVKESKNDTSFLTRPKYKELLSQVKAARQARELGIIVQPALDNLAKKFVVVVTSEGVERLAPANAKSNKTPVYVRLDELFSIISKVHDETNHGSLSEMTKSLKNKYKNVSNSAIVTYLKLCRVCRVNSRRTRQAAKCAPEDKEDESKENEQLKQVKKKISKIAKPPENGVGEERRKNAQPPPIKKFRPRNPRGYVPISNKPLTWGLRTPQKIDFIDMINRQDYDYNYIVVLRESTTKFVHLRPMKSKSPLELSDLLVSIFVCFGTPSLLVTSTPDFIQSALEGIYDRSPTIPTDIEVVRTDEETEFFADIETLMLAWVCQNTNDRWYNGLRFIQYIANLTYNADILKTPFEAMFGRKGKLDVRSLNLPEELICGIRTEEDSDEEVKDVDISEMLEVVLTDEE